MKNVNTFVEEIISLDNFDGIETKYSSYAQAARAGISALLSEAKKVDLDMYAPLYDALIDCTATAPAQWETLEAQGEFYGDLYRRMQPHGESLADAATELWSHLYTPDGEYIDRQPWDKAHYVGEYALGFIGGAAQAARVLCRYKDAYFDEDEEDIQFEEFFDAVDDELQTVARPLIWGITAQREAADAESKK